MYKSTRSRIRVNASQAIIQGLASDGGLFVVERIPKVDMASLRFYDYPMLAEIIMTLFLDDFSQEDISTIVDATYRKQFTHPQVVGCRHIEDAMFLELFYGPTLAFKDMALTVLPHLLKKAKEIQGIKEDSIILTATSGDTGSATLSGFANIDGMKVVVFYPFEGVSDIQEKQMLHFQSEKCKSIALMGNFDDAQHFVKELFGQYPNLSSSNSINIGRLIPQIVYYFYGYMQMVNNGDIDMGESINVSVPTGNFGNIYASYIAKEMGLPIKTFICASNENHVLTEFFKTGIYNKNRTLIKTSSPSMDILISSNLERLLYAISSEEEVNDLMEQLKIKGSYQITETMKTKLHSFYGGYITDTQTKKTMQQVYQKLQYLMDPHTAVAYQVYRDYQKQTNDNTKTMIVSTAHMYKFPQTIGEVLGLSHQDDSQLIEAIAQRTKITVPVAIKHLKPNEKEVWKKDEKQALFAELYERLLCSK